MNFLPSALRGLLLSATMLLVGIPPTLLLAIHPLRRKYNIKSSVTDWMTLFLVGSCLLVVFLSTTLLALHRYIGYQSTSAVPIGRFMITGPGRIWLVETSIGLVLGTVTLASATGIRSVSKRIWLQTVSGGGLLVLLVVCLTSYSTTIPDEQVAILLKFGHLTGAALWVGGIFALVTIVPILLKRTNDTDVDLLAAGVIRRFSPIATIGVSLAVATGFMISSWHVPSTGVVHSTQYGLMLVGKMILALLAATLGGINRFVLLNHLEARAGGQAGILTEEIPPLLIFGLCQRSPVQNTVELFIRLVRIELGVLIVVILISVGLQSHLEIPHVTPLVYTTSSDFRRVLQFIAIAVAAIGVTTIVYEMRNRDTI